MILAIDIGNTTVALGGIKDGRVCFVAHMDTVRTRTAAEYRAEMERIFSRRRNPERKVWFEGAVLTSVVPQLTGALAACARHYTGRDPVIVGPDIRTGLRMGVPDPDAVGKDRIADAAYAAANYPLPVVTVDLGTATTFNAVNEQCEFIGGAIAPGIRSSMDSLVSGTARLPRVEIEIPKSVIGKNTTTNMQAGLVFGFAGLVDYIVKKIKREMKRPDMPVVATGGFSEIIAKEVSCIDHVDKLLTLQGLKYLYDLNTTEVRK